MSQQQANEVLAVFEKLRQYASCEEIKARLGGAVHEE